MCSVNVCVWGGGGGGLSSLRTNTYVLNYTDIQWSLSKMGTVLGSHLSKTASIPGPK